MKFNLSEKPTTQCSVWAFGTPIRENNIVKKTENQPFAEFKYFEINQLYGIVLMHKTIRILNM